MLRGIISIIALLIIIGSLIIIVPIMIIPNTFLHQLVPVLKPLHQAIACRPGETMDYETFSGAESDEVRFLCVDAAGNERHVDDILLRPAQYALGTLCLGVLLMLGPFLIAMRKLMRSESGPQLQAAFQQSYDQLRQIPTAMTQDSSPTAVSTMLNASGQQQLEALDKLRQQGLISQDAYETARQSIFDHFSAGQNE
jgi:hypothetical protein